MKLSIMIPFRAKLLYPFRYETPCKLKNKKIKKNVGKSNRGIFLGILEKFLEQMSWSKFH